MSNWEAAEARLEQAYTMSSMQHVQVRKADIRAPLERVNDLENACMVHHDEVARLREALEEMVRVSGVAIPAARRASCERAMAALAAAKGK